MRKLSSLLLVVSSFAFVGCSEEEGTTLEDTGSPDTGKADTAVAVDTGVAVDSGTDTGTAADSTVTDSAATDSTATDSTTTDSTATDSTATDSSSTDSSGDSATTKTKTVWVLRVDGATTVTDGGTVADTATSAPIFLAPFTINYGAAPTGTAGTVVAAPAAGTNAVSLPSSSSIGGLALSGNGKLVSFAAYHVAPGVADIAKTAPAVNKRAAVTVNAGGSFVVSDLGAEANGASNSVRSAYTTDGGQFWIGAEDKGVTYNVGTTVTPLAAANLRWVGTFGGQLYVSTGSGSGVLSGLGPGLLQVGTGLPTATATLAKVNGPATGASPYGFVLLDTDSTAGADTLLLCDTGSSTKGIQKWKLEGTTWTLKATHLASVTGGCQGLAAWLDGTDIIAVATTGETPPKVVVLRDPLASTTAIATGTTVDTAPANAVFKGVALAPSP
ncbi:MAG: hypothetical protein JNL79_05680 [Myxococcales bacterium]|nr:hypothetical protein [Myxococcales bacterium]